MKKLSSNNLLRSFYLIAVIAVVCLLYSCTASEKLKPHQNKEGDTYCVYTITKAPDGADLKKGDTVCIYCNDTGKRCASTKTVEINGKKYDLVIQGSTCESCPGNNTFEKDE